jgi:arylsulfatase A-like enzyme
MIYENGRVRDDVKDKYGPDVFCNFLIDFIKRNKDRPFLAYYPMTIAHEISNDLKVPPPPGPDGRYQSFKELVEYMDKLVGRIIETLNELNLRENTLILFTGDNGTPMQFITNVVDGEYIREPVFSEINGRMVQGGKSKLTDAGTHVPLIANWKGTAPAGTINNDLIDFSDFMPTLAELAHQELPANVIIDGKSFAPRIKGLPGNPRNWIYNEYEDNYWIRNHKWKLYGDGKLFDMENDPDEESPVSEEPDSVKNVRDKFNDVLQQLRSD